MDSPSPRRTYPENQNLLPFYPHNIPSPNSSSSSNNGIVHHIQQLPPLSPTTPKSVTRSESSATQPTTFVQADSSSFKQVVQMLTGCSETAKQASAIFTPTIITTTTNNVGLSNNHHHHHHMIPPMKTMPPPQQQQPHQSGYKLYQRRNNNFNINPLLPSFPKPYPYPSHHASGLLSPAHEVAMSPSILDFPSLVLSPVTPLIPDPFVRSGPAAPTGYALYPHVGNKCSYLDHLAVAEEKAIQEKGFYLHPSPSTTPRGTEPPRLLPLFPTTSPRAEAEAEAEAEGAAASSPSS